MGIILSILQILGIILLSLLGLGILAVLLVLFVPVRYVVSGDIHEKVHLEGKISWLLSLFRAKFSYEDELLYAEIGILWKKTCISKEFGAEEDDEDSDETEEDSEADNNTSGNDENIENTKKVKENSRNLNMIFI